MDRLRAGRGDRPVRPAGGLHGAVRLRRRRAQTTRSAARSHARATAGSLDVPQPDLLAAHLLFDLVLPAQSQGPAAGQRDPRGSPGSDRCRPRPGAAAPARSRSGSGYLRAGHCQGPGGGTYAACRGAEPPPGRGSRAPGELDQQLGKHWRRRSSGSRRPGIGRSPSSRMPRSALPRRRRSGSRASESPAAAAQRALHAVRARAA